jgi:hypothetical protein
MHAADAEDKDYEQRLLKVGAQRSVLVPMNSMLLYAPKVVCSGCPAGGAGGGKKAAAGAGAATRAPDARYLTI